MKKITPKLIKKVMDKRLDEYQKLLDLLLQARELSNGLVGEGAYTAIDISCKLVASDRDFINDIKK